MPPTAKRRARSRKAAAVDLAVHIGVEQDQQFPVEVDGARAVVWIPHAIFLQQ